MKIIYMGSGAFATKPLERLIQSSHKVVGVFTSPINNQGASAQVSAIKAIAEKQGIKVYEPRSLRTQESQSNIESIDADIIVVASYGHILDSQILGSKKLGAINIHPSDLPSLRGPAPLQHTILLGLEKSAVCIIRMDTGVDTGPILARREFSLEAQMYYHELESRCSQIGADLLIETLNNFESLEPILQESLDLEPSYARFITKMDGFIDWTKPAVEIERKIRAFARWPGSFFVYKGEQIKIFKAMIENTEEKNPVPAGTTLDNSLGVACGVGILRPIILQRPGRKAVFTEEFLRGFFIPKGEFLGCKISKA